MIIMLNGGTTILAITAISIVEILGTLKIAAPLEEVAGIRVATPRGEQ